jgi:hypothetical protein
VTQSFLLFRISVYLHDTATVGFLAHQQIPARVYFDDTDSWVHAAPEQEQNTLQKLDTQVLLPLTLKTGCSARWPRRPDWLSKMRN